MFTQLLTATNATRLQSKLLDIYLNYHYNYLFIFSSEQIRKTATMTHIRYVTDRRDMKTKMAGVTQTTYPFPVNLAMTLIGARRMEIGVAVTRWESHAGCEPHSPTNS